MNKDLYDFGNFRFDGEQGILLHHGERISLPPKVFQVLGVLLQHQGEVVSKASLMQAVWPDSFVEESSLTQSIFLLRKALGKTEDGAEIIETLPKRGYRMTLPVAVTQRSGGPVQDPAKTVLPPPESAPAEDLSLAASGNEPVPAAARKPFAARWAIYVAVGMVVAASALYGFQRSGLIWERPSILRSVRLTNDGAYKERLISLLSDGARVYFSEDVDAKSYLAEVSTEGGETVRRASPNPIDSALSFSPASNEILFGALWEQKPEHHFSALSLDGSTVRSVGDLNGHAASWSHDGSRIVYARGLGIFIANADGSDAHEIAHMTEPPYWPRWSPDGSRIRFSVQPWTQSVGLWEVNADGQNLHPLFTGDSWSRQACCGDWSSDGRYYVFVVDQAIRSSLWIARDQRHPWQSGKATQLAEGPVDFWRAPLVSRDNRHIYALGEQARGELIRFNPSSGQFQPYLGGLSTDTVSFSRDGQWMAWTAYPEGTLWRSRIDGSDRRRLTPPGKVARFPHWSPDGSQLLYITAGPDSLWKVYRVSAAGGRPEALISDKTNQGVATWSPDGQKIAFGQIVTFGVGQQKEQIRIFDLKTHAVSVLPNSSGMWTARWSPAGNYISAVTADNRKLMLFDLEKSTWTELANVGSNDCVWSHDGEYIYFDSPWEAVIYRVRVKTRELERYASLQGIRRTGFFGWSLNLAPDDSPVLLREEGIHEVYSLDVRLP